MKSGLLWYDNSKLTLAQKIEAANARYTQKFGVPANTAFVNARDLEKGVVKLEGIEVRTKHTILPNHIWLGII
jgi:hypothetical protein